MGAKRAGYVVGISLISLSVAACNVTKKDAMTVGGAGAGAALGSLFGSGTGRIISMVAGAAAGAWLGRELAGYLDEREQRQLVRQTQSTATTGRTETWTNPDTGTRVSTEVTGQTTSTESFQVPVKKSKLSNNEMPPFDFVGKQFNVLKNANVRGGPSTNFKVVGSLRANTTVDVIGKVTGKPWYIIGENGVVDGFVYTTLLQPTEAAVATVLADPSAGDNPDVNMLSATTTANCREITQTIVLKDGKEKTETVKACEGPNGWQTKAA